MPAAVYYQTISLQQMAVNLATDIPALYAGIAASSPANPTAKVGLAAVNGVAATTMRSDAAPPIDQSIAPTWTGNHTWTPSAGIPLTINGLAASVSLNAVSAPYFCTNNGKPSLQMNSVGSNYGVVGNISSNLWGLGTTATLNSAFTSAVQWNASNQVGFNGNAPVAQSTGYGTPTGGAKQASFAAGSITLPNLAAAVAQLILDLKATGLLGT